MCGNSNGLRFSWRSEDFGVENSRQDFDSVDDARAGAAEIRSGVRRPNFVSATSRQIVPAFRQFSRGQLAQNVFLVIAAGNQNNYFRRIGADFFWGRGETRCT